MSPPKQRGRAYEIFTRSYETPRVDLDATATADKLSCGPFRAVGVLCSGGWVPKQSRPCSFTAGAACSCSSWGVFGAGESEVRQRGTPLRELEMGDCLGRLSPKAGLQGGMMPTCSKARNQIDRCRSKRIRQVGLSTADCRTEKEKMQQRKRWCGAR